MRQFGFFLCLIAAVWGEEAQPPAVPDSAAGPVVSQPKLYKAIPGESRITYFIKHPLHEVEGFSGQFDCKVELAPDTLQSKITVKAPVAAFSSRNSNRDSHTLELLDAFKYPFVEFASDSVRRDGKGFRVHGQLNFHGVKKPVDYPVDWWKKDGKIHIEVEFKIKLSEHKVKRPSLMLISTEDVLRIKIHAVAKDP